MSTIVFLGPSLRPSRVPVGTFEFRPPVTQGDVLRALEAGATKIGIIDGYFDLVPSVWHKEILFALEKGVLVYGAASMGALRAAELHRFGMIGVGRVFEMFRDGLLEDDDEVALLHSPADDGYRAISEAMVNLRDLVETAVARGLVARPEASSAIARLKALPYPQRTMRRLAELVPSLSELVKAPPALLKERDAVALLEEIQRARPRTLNPARVERTIFLERLRLECREPRSAHEGRREHLLRLIASEHALRAGVTPSAHEVGAVLREIKEARGLMTDEELARLLEERGIAIERFVESARGEAAIRRLELFYDAEIETLEKLP